MEVPATTVHSTPARTRTAAGYGAMIVLAGLALWGIHLVGGGVSAPPPTGSARGAAAAHGSGAVLFHVLLAMVVIVLAARALGALFQRLQQPAVVGEVIAGIALGPSVLGAVAPSVSLYLLPPEVAPYLGILAQVGVILFMFLVGLELDTRLLREKPHATLAISHASIVAPFVLGALQPCGCTHASPAATCRSICSPCSWVSPCRSRRFPCSRAS